MSCYTYNTRIVIQLKSEYVFKFGAVIFLTLYYQQSQRTHKYFAICIYIIHSSTPIGSDRL